MSSRLLLKNSRSHEAGCHSLSGPGSACVEGATRSQEKTVKGSRLSRGVQPNRWQSVWGPGRAVTWAGAVGQFWKVFPL